MTIVKTMLHRAKVRALAVMTSEDVTRRVVETDDIAANLPWSAGPHRIRLWCTDMMREESMLSIIGDCVSAFRLRAARLRLLAAAKERDQ